MYQVGLLHLFKDSPSFTKEDTGEEHKREKTQERERKKKQGSPPIME